MPFPGAGDDMLELGVLGRPVEIALDFIGACYEAGGIARPSGSIKGRDLFFCDMPGCFDDLADGVTSPIPKVVYQTVLGLERL